MRAAHGWIGSINGLGAPVPWQVQIRCICPVHEMCIGCACRQNGCKMPLPQFVTLIVAVIAAAGATIALAAWSGLPLVALGLLALIASLWPGLRRWK